MTEVILFDPIHYKILLNTQYGLKGSQLQHVSRAVLWCFKHNEENVMICFDLDQFLKIQKMTFGIKQGS